jgi:hypothetical protein
VVAGCELRLTSGEAVRGRAISVATPDGTVWLAESAGDDRDLVLRGEPGADCAPLEIVARNALPAPAEGTRSGLGGVFAGDRALWFFREDVPDPQAAFGVRTAGFGVASGPSFDAVEAGADLLWTGDRPPYGAAVVSGGDQLYAYGCVGARYLDADCYAARVPAGAADRRGAYEYWTGADLWHAAADDAFPLLAAGTQVSVAWHPSLKRYLMAYVTPLGDRLTVRSAPGPDGPWSAPFDAGRCLLPADFEGPYCQAVDLHPEAATGRRIVLTYGAASFGDGSAPTRRVEVEAPADLP